jgi:hypothetical protein
MAKDYAVRRIKNSKFAPKTVTAKQRANLRSAPPIGSPAGMTGIQAGSLPKPRGLSPADYEAIAAARIRIPKTATPVEAKIAQRGLERLIEVMEGRVPFRKANAALKAAVMVREEICGPIQRTVEVKGGLSLEALVSAASAAPVVDVGSHQAVLPAAEED